MSKTVKCPTCKTQVKWNEGSVYRPFCSERCRLIDLGEWASEKHAIPAEPVPSTEELPFSISEQSEKY